MKTAKVTVAGKERTAKFPVMALIRLEKEAGINIKDLQEQDSTSDLETIVAIIWAGLVTDDPDLTMEYLAENMEISELTEVAQTVMSVMSDEGKKAQAF